MSVFFFIIVQSKYKWFIFNYLWCLFSISQEKESTSINTIYIVSKACISFNNEIVNSNSIPLNIFNLIGNKTKKNENHFYKFKFSLPPPQIILI